MLVSSLHGGGAERQAALWARAAAALGHDVTVLALRRHEDEFEIAPGVRVEYVEKAGPFDLLRMGRAVRRLAHRSEVVAAFQSYSALLCAFSRIGVPWLAITGADPREVSDTSRIPPAILHRGLELASLRSAPTEGLIDCHRSLGIAAAKPWVQIPNIVDEGAFEAKRDGKRGALFVGRLVPEKGPLRAVDVASEAEVPLTVLGDGPLAADIDRRAAASGRPGGVRRVSFTPEPWDIYARHRVCLVTSHYEAFGSMIVESLAAGTPVVSVDCDFGPREILAGATYSSVVRDDPGALASELSRVMVRPYTEDEAQECVRLAGAYRQDRVAPSIEAALESVLP